MADNIRKPRDSDFFTYVINSGSSAAGSTITQQLQIESDSEFVLYKMTQFSDVAGAAQTDDTYVVPLVTIQITDGSSTRSLLSQPAAIGALFGNGKIPMILPRARRYRANSTITFTFVNFSAATTYANVRLNLIGVKNWY